MSAEEMARRHEVWKRAVAEHGEQKEQLRRDGLLVKYAGKKLLLNTFLIPKTLRSFFKNFVLKSMPLHLQFTIKLAVNAARSFNQMMMTENG
jgi:hypothetical protein